LLQRVTAEVRQRLERHPALDEWLRAELSKAAAQWPTVSERPEAFLGFLATWLSKHWEASSRLEDVSLSELYLVSACVDGDSRALAAFEGAYLRELGRSLGQTGLGPADAEEVRQGVLEKLFVAEGGQAPRIVAYAGRGQIGGLIQVMAARGAIDLRRRRGESVHVQAEAAMESLPSPELDPELRLLKERYRAQFQRAFEVAVRSLSARERNLLRYQLVEGLNVDQIALVYQVHRATAARWAAAARERLAAGTRAGLQVALALPASEMEGLMRWVPSEVDLSIRRLFATEPGTAKK
jgi:RNA polymerase sigma-70 factor (ECF subfamily)